MNYQNTAGQALADYGASMPNSPPRAPRTEQLIGRLDKSLTEFVGLTQRLQNVADRLLGPIPEGVDSNKAVPDPANVIGRLESMTESLGSLLRRLGQATERLETL